MTEARYPWLNGPDGVKQRIVEYCAAFPDLSITVEGMIAEGDTVITTWTLRGIHRGEFLGIAPSGNNVEVTGTTLHRVEGGVIVAARVNWDTLTLMRQIGALP
jgi:predicted ester cyclase